MIKNTILIYIVILIITGIGVYFTLRFRKNKPLIHHFTASTLWKAFVLNSIASALIIFIAISTKKQFDDLNIIVEDEDEDDKKVITSTTNAISVILTLTTTFMTSMVAYTIMYVLFGFGGGMIAVK